MLGTNTSVIDSFPVKEPSLRQIRKSRQYRLELIPENPSFISLKGDCSDQGCQAEFYRLGNARFGIKVYYDLDLAIHSYTRQKIAASVGVAPQVGRFLLVHRRKGAVGFGFETEKAKRVYAKDDIWKEQHIKLFNKLNQINLAGDFAPENCGILDAKLVAVDFGSHSVATTNRH